MYHDTEQWYNGASVERARQSGGAESRAGDGNKLEKKGAGMEATLREMQQAERNVARLEMAAAAAEAAAGEYGKRLDALRERLDDLVLQVGVVQASMADGDFDTAWAEFEELWLILHAVDRRFRDLLA